MPLNKKIRKACGPKSMSQNLVMVADGQTGKFGLGTYQIRKHCNFGEASLKRKVERDGEFPQNHWSPKGGYKIQCSFGLIVLLAGIIMFVGETTCGCNSFIRRW